MAMALEKYQELGDTAHADLIRTKISASGEKSDANREKERQAEGYMEAGRAQEVAGDKLEAKKQYLFAKNLYKELKMDDKVMEVDGLLEVLEAAIVQEKESQAKEKESQEAAQAQGDGTGASGGAVGWPTPKKEAGPDEGGPGMGLGDGNPGAGGPGGNHQAMDGLEGDRG